MNLEQQRWYSGGDCTVGLVKYGLWAEKWLSDLTPSVIRCSTSINLPWPDPLSIRRVCYTTAEQCAVLVSSHCRRIPFNCAAFAENFCTHLLQICYFYHFSRHGQKGRRGDYPNCQEDGQNGAEEERGEKHEKNKCLALPAASRQGSREFTAKLGANGLWWS